MPAYVMGEGDPYRPETLFWMSAEGAILGHAMGKPGTMIAAAAQSLRDTIEQPMIGPPHAPERVRVASPELAAALRGATGDIEIVCSPTPEIDAVFATMRERIGEGTAPEQSYLAADIGPESVDAVFRAAAALYRAKPWKLVPSDQDLAVSIESLGVRDAALSIIGQMGQSLGFVLFSSLEDFELYLDAAVAFERGHEPRMPPHFALNYERGAELSTALRKEISVHGWEVAGPGAYPWLVAIDEDLVARPASARELVISEAIALALPKLLAEKKKTLLAALDGGPAVERTLLVHTHAGDLEVTLRIPFEPPASRSSFDLIADLADLGRDGAEIDDAARRKLEDELVEKFASSPEGKGLPDIGACHYIMDFAASYFGASVATLDARDLREILFEIVPRKVSIDATEAHSIIEELRAFYLFLGREFGLKQAPACLRVLGSDAAKRLKVALSDPSKFGMAKSLFMGGREAGFEMSSQEGVASWLRAIEGQPLPASFRLPSVLPFADRGAARTKKSKRKAVSKARKKNR